MRIISGEFKGATLLTAPGDNTRPTTDFLKEAMFSVLDDCEVDRVCDLFAGSGALGLEALSRGAGHAVFIDLSRKAVGVIQRNIEKLRCAERTQVTKQKVSAFLKEQPEPFDLILMDPPYNQNLINPTVELVFSLELLTNDGRLVVEHSVREPLDPKWNPYISFQKRYRESLLTILSRENAT
jgi:16S rRNA (guanine966-N2)-methyltransferase